MSNWINSNGGLVASIVIAVTCLNIILSAVQSICNALKVKDPSWLQKAASVLSTVTSWLSANIPSSQGKSQLPPQS